MTKFARVAPCGLVRYRSHVFGQKYQGNLFSVQFNTHRVLRHIVIRDGASFRTQDEEFLTSGDPDFHPTDIIEDADGSLLLIDTGGWFIKGCPRSEILSMQSSPVSVMPEGLDESLTNSELADLLAFLEAQEGHAEQAQLQR